MKRNSQKFIAFVIALAVGMGSSLVIYANEPEQVQTSESDTEYYSDRTDIIQVVLPTNTIGIFDFILDPQQLINQTNGAAYEGKKFEEDATLFFERFDGETEEDYSSTSDAVTFVNKGHTPVDVLVFANVKASDPDLLTMTDDREFTEDTSASLYLALTDGDATIPVLTEEGVSLCGTIPAASEEGDGSYSFRLTGAANGKGDWSVMKDVGIEVTVTWMIIPDEETDMPAEEDQDTKQLPLEDMKATPSLPATPSSPSNATESVTINSEEGESPASVGMPSDILEEEDLATKEAVVRFSNVTATETETY